MNRADSGRIQRSRAEMIKHHVQPSHVDGCFDDPPGLMALGIADARRISEIEDGHRTLRSRAVPDSEREDLDRDPGMACSLS
jgi:hypothetical protein